MADSLPPPPSTRTAPAPKAETRPKFDPPVTTNELTMLGQFILEHGTRDFDVDLGALIQECGELHDLYAGNCKTGHFYTDIPCDEYERSLALGIAWLKARISEEARRAS